MKPGTNITMKINTQRDSLVCITALDKSSKLLSTGNEISLRTVLQNMRSDKSYSNVHRKEHPGKLSGIVTLYIENFDSPILEPITALGMHFKTQDNLRESMKIYDVIMTTSNDPSERRRKPNIDYNRREDFPETWLFNEVDV